MDRGKIPVDLIMAKLEADVISRHAPPGKGPGYLSRPSIHGYRGHAV